MFLPDLLQGALYLWIQRSSLIKKSIFIKRIVISLCVGTVVCVVAEKAYMAALAAGHAAYLVPDYFVGTFFGLLAAVFVAVRLAK